MISTDSEASTRSRSPAYSSATRASTTKCNPARLASLSRSSAASSNTTEYGPVCDWMRNGSDTREASVDHDVLAAEIRVFRTRQPRHECGDLVGPGEAADRHARDQLRDARLSEHAPRELGIHEPRRHAV